VHPLLAEPDVSAPVYDPYGPEVLPAPRRPLPIRPILVLGLLLCVIGTPWKATPEVSALDKIFTPVMAFRYSPCEGCVPASWQLAVQPAAKLPPSPANKFRKERIQEALLDPGRVNDYQDTDIITQTKLAAIRAAIGKALSDLPDRVARLQTIRIRDISVRLIIEISQTDRKNCRQYRVSLNTAGKEISGAVLKACPSLNQNRR